MTFWFLYVIMSSDRYDDDYDERVDRDERIDDDDYDVDDDRAWEPADEDDVARATAARDDEMVYADGREGDDSWLGAGLGVALILAGLALFLFPEPATSLAGIVMMVLGAIIWVAATLG